MCISLRFCLQKKINIHTVIVTLLLSHCHCHTSWRCMQKEQSCHCTRYCIARRYANLGKKRFGTVIKNSINLWTCSSILKVIYYPFMTSYIIFKELYQYKFTFVLNYFMIINYSTERFFFRTNGSLRKAIPGES